MVGRKTEGERGERERGERERGMSKIDGCHGTRMVMIAMFGTTALRRLASAWRESEKARARASERERERERKREKEKRTSEYTNELVSKVNQVEQNERRGKKEETDENTDGIKTSHIGSHPFISTHVNLLYM